VKSPGSVTGDERLRFFLAFRLPDDVLRELVEWQAQALRGRVVPRENLHVTLAFLGARPGAELEPILGVLEDAAGAASQPLFELVRWRETRAAGMLELRDRTAAGAELAQRLQQALAELGAYRPESRLWLPHVTVLRYRERPRLSPPLPELGAFAPSEAAAYLSRLHPSGAEYVLLQSFPLGG
jgi:RNA 2',3'-cyclic 3'-phosphodiesterase